jgi:hypothetical protein
MMAAVAEARQAGLKRYFRPDHRAIASINSPMQCMMKEICAQCLQRHRDPVTGTETVVFSCFNQDQEMDRVDFRTLPPPLAERRPGKTNEALGRPLPAASRRTPGNRGGVRNPNRARPSPVGNVL